MMSTEATRPVIIQVVQAPATVGRVVYDQYNGKAAKVLGIMQVVLAASVIIFNIAAICLELETSYRGSFISAGVFWTITGAFGIASSQRRTQCFIVTTMVLSILCAIGVPGLLGNGAAWVVEAAEYDDDSSSSSGEIPEGCGCFTEYNAEEGVTQEICVDCVVDDDDAYVMKSGVALGSLVLIATVCEFIVSIAASAFCCRAVCCCSRRQPPMQPMMRAGQPQYVVVNGQAQAMPQNYQVVPPAAAAQQMKAPLPDAPQYTAEPPPAYTVDHKY